MDSELGVKIVQTLRDDCDRLLIVVRAYDQDYDVAAEAIKQVERLEDVYKLLKECEYDEDICKIAFAKIEGIRTVIDLIKMCDEDDDEDEYITAVHEAGIERMEELVN